MIVIMRKLYCDNCKKEVDKLRTTRGKTTFKNGFESLTIEIYKKGYSEMCIKCWKESLEEMMVYLKES